MLFIVSTVTLASEADRTEDVIHHDVEEGIAVDVFGQRRKKNATGVTSETAWTAKKTSRPSANAATPCSMTTVSNPSNQWRGVCVF